MVRSRTISAIAASLAAVLVCAGAGPANAAIPTTDPTDPDPAVVAESHLEDDATAPLTVRESDDGTIAFAGAGEGKIDNPDVGTRTSVNAAAHAHLERYGAAFGADGDLTRTGVTETAAGTDVVRYQQRVDGIPVLGAEVALTLRPDRELASVLSTTSPTTRAPVPVVDEQTAAAQARAVVAKVANGRPFTVTPRGLWVVDSRSGLPGLVGGARTAWRFEASDGGALRRFVLVDAASARTLANVDVSTGLDRVVCDNANVPLQDITPCTDPVRTEGDEPTDVADVDEAYDLTGATADFYHEIGDLDLTAMLGVDVDGTKRLSSTVRFCFLTEPCPYENAFWSGEQMVYGAGFAVADDVVAHELTHGVTERTSNLPYWGQSGAINESMSDVMGEIVDHRHPSDGDTDDSWTIGEDLAGGPFRDLADPTTFGNPDTMTSPLWDADLGHGDDLYRDNGGVHTNSGVGNKTFFLISQGGAFRGRTLTGIDADDPTLTKSATLYLSTLASLVSGSDYADLGRTLVQTCQTLAGRGTAGFTTADCTNVAAATAATELEKTPTNAPQPADAPATCPAPTTKRVLLDGESGTPETAFTAGPLWSRAPSDVASANATSGTESWDGADPDPSATDPSEPAGPDESALTVTRPIAIPRGQRTYLRFQQWRLFEWDPDSGATWDGGVVTVDQPGHQSDPTSTLPWVNGPTSTLIATEPFLNKFAGTTAFGGDSFGWVASRVDLSSYGGRSIQPTFSVLGDEAGAFIGWYLDDIELYTCDPPRAVGLLARPTVAGTARYGQTLSATGGRFDPSNATRSYQWLRDGTPIARATGSRYTLAVADVGRRVSVRVTATAPARTTTTVTTAAVTVSPATLTAAVPTISGKARVGKTLRVGRGAWTSGTTLRQQWYRNGRTIRGATATAYRLTKGDRRAKITVRVTGSRPGYTTRTVQSRPTAKVRPRR